MFHRSSAVETLGDVFGSARGADVVEKSTKTWRAWIGRGKDAEWKVRKGWVEKVGKMIAGKAADLKAELERESISFPTLARVQQEQSVGLTVASPSLATTALLRTKLSDPDEHVRETTCKIYGHLDYETVLHHIKKPALKDLSSRMMDKKVREQSLPPS